jgi:hypothetical protein
VSPVKYELGFYISADAILHSTLSVSTCIREELVGVDLLLLASLYISYIACKGVLYYSPPPRSDK